jgi:hypothetical protein
MCVTLPGRIIVSFRVDHANCRRPVLIEPRTHHAFYNTNGRGNIKNALVLQLVQIIKRTANKFCRGGRASRKTRQSQVLLRHSSGVHVESGGS